MEPSNTPRPAAKTSSDALMIWLGGIAVAHVLRVFLVEDEDTARAVVALAGSFVYGGGALLAAEASQQGRESLLAECIAVAFPVVGLVAVVGSGNAIDLWQIAVGVTQVALMIFVTRDWLVGGDDEQAE